MKLYLEKKGIKTYFDNLKQVTEFLRDFSLCDIMEAYNNDRLALKGYTLHTEK